MIELEPDRAPADQASGRRVPNFRKRTRRPELILDAAAEVFFLKGYEKARLEDVAKVAGVSKTAVVYHFGSKRELIGAVIERHCLPLKPPAAASNAIEIGLTDFFATKVLGVVMAEGRNIPALGRLYAIAMFNRVASWQVFEDADAARAAIGHAVGRVAAMAVLGLGFPEWPAADGDGGVLTP